MPRRLYRYLWLLIGFAAPVSAMATTHQINIQGFAFTPAKTRVNYGDTVRWTNLDASNHTVTSVSGSAKSFNSGTLTTNQSFSIVIGPSDGRGPFPYHCAIHTSMVDTLFVLTNHTINITGFDYVPAGLVINPGDTVTWVNLDPVGHTATADPSSPKQWDSGPLGEGQSFKLVFTSADGVGPFPYHCTPHPAMKDTLSVNPMFCCTGTTGDVNMAGIIDLSDLSLLITYLTSTPRPTLPCPAEANVNAAGIIDLSDLSLLISYLTVTPRPALPNCPS